MSAPALSGKRATNLTLKWSAPDEPGGALKIQYILQWDEGHGDRDEADFVVLYKGDERRFKVRCGRSNVFDGVDPVRGPPRPSVARRARPLRARPAPPRLPPATALCSSTAD